MKKTIALFLLNSLFALSSTAQDLTDTLKVIDLEEVSIVSSPKESRKFRQQPLAVSLISPSDLQNKQLNSLKNISAYIPNFVMPDYGSRLTSSIYIRGIGSRINSPAVGMYVDNIPYLDKSAYDISLFGVERVDVLRGPQGTLYGKNTMGGLIKVHTRNPFLYQGTDIKLSAATKDGHWGISALHLAKLNDQFAFSLGGYYEGTKGFYTNEYLSKKVDAMKAGGLRTRLLYKPTPVWSFDFTASYDNSDEGGYPYGIYDTQTRKVQPISTDQQGSYRRSVLNAGLNVEINGEHLVFNSITGFQNLKDRMFMDQDFTTQNIFTLEQRQKLNAFTQELSLKNKNAGLWQWTTGTFYSHQHLKTSSPVTFHEDGMTMLEKTINGYFPESISGMTLNLDFQANEMSIPADFVTPVSNYAIFHQSNFNFGSWTLTLGARLEHERMSIDYDASCETPYKFVAAYYQMQIPVEKTASTRYVGSLKNHYTQLLPKFSLQYNINKDNNIYVSVSKGYRSGGYNLQMFSDIAQGGLQNSMYSQIKTDVTNTFEALKKRGMPSAVADRIIAAMGQYMQEKEINVASTITYKPEISWNYELGTHFSLLSKRVLGDADIFYMRIKDQQITRFVDSGFGRILVNAGKSENYGAELNLTGQITNQFSLSGAFGYTHAKFIKYDTASEGTTGEDYFGNRVPFVPTYTYSIGGDYRIPTRGVIHNLIFGANLLGTGKIYWSEDNSQSQSAYAQLGAHALMDSGLVSVDFWGKNLTNTDYTVFCFKNGSTSTAKFIGQRGKPLQLGIDVRFHF